MAERIELRCDPERIATARWLREPLARFEYAERVPVIFGIATRYLLHARGVGFLEYASDPVVQMRHQLLNYQWQLEHLPGDWIMGPGVAVQPDFQQGAQAGNFECEVAWRDDVPPAIIPPLRDEDDVAQLQRPPLDGGMFGEAMRWRQAMLDAVDRFEVTFNGEPVQLNVGLPVPGGPFAKALALAQENLLLWMAASPETAHRLLQLCTDAHLQCEVHARELCGRRMTNAGYGCDGAEMLSPASFGTFVTPYHERCYRHFGGERALHMCGRIDHLLDILANDWRLDNLTGFGWETSKPKLAATLGGKARMHGGVNCRVLETGTPVDVRAAAFEALESLAPSGGYMLCDGYNLAPGTPLENLQAMVEAAVEYGKPVQTSSA